jgi:hypothetical protein
MMRLLVTQIMVFQQAQSGRTYLRILNVLYVALARTNSHKNKKSPCVLHRAFLLFIINPLELQINNAIIKLIIS